MDSTIFSVKKEKWGYYLRGNLSALDTFHTRPEHGKFWRKFSNKTIKRDQFDIDIFPNIGDGYFDTDYAVPRGYKATDEYNI